MNKREARARARASRKFSSEDHSIEGFISSLLAPLQRGDRHYRKQTKGDKKKIN